MPRPLVIGSLIALFAALICALMGVTVKLMSEDQSVWDILMYQSLIGLLFVSLQRALKPTPRRTSQGNLIMIHFLRALSGVGACALAYVSLQFIPLSLEMILASSFPLFVPIFGFFAGQAFDRRLLKYLVVSFVGVWMVVDPRLGAIHPAAFLALGGGIFTALSLVLMSDLLKKGESPANSVFYYSLFSSLLVGIIWLSQDERSFVGWHWGVTLGLLFYLQQISFNLACKYLQPLQLSIILYTSLIFTGILDYALWNFLPTQVHILGLALIGLSSIFAVALREQTKSAPQKIQELPDSPKQALEL